MTAILGTIAILMAVLVATVLWVRSEHGWLPGAGALDALAEVAARLFPRQTLPRDRLQARLWRVVRTQVSLDAHGQGLVPSVVRVSLASEDFDMLEGLVDWTARDLAERLVAIAKRNGWQVLAPPIVVLQADPDRPLGRPVATSDFTPKTRIEPSEHSPQPATRPSTTARLVGIEAAPTFALTGDGPYTIGRDRGCDLRVKDELVSRVHARLQRKGDQWEAVDLGSTNGLKVNGAAVVAPVVLRQGDELAMSSKTAFRCEFPTVDPNPRQVGDDGPTTPAAGGRD